MTQQQCDMARQLNSEGYSLRKIGEQLGIGFSTVKRYLDGNP
jgi:predicted transcriptional regulator